MLVAPALLHAYFEMQQICINKKNHSSNKYEPCNAGDVVNDPLFRTACIFLFHWSLQSVFSKTAIATSWVKKFAAIKLAGVFVV